MKIFILILLVVVCGCTSSYDDCFCDCAKVNFDKDIGMCEVGSNTASYDDIREFCYDECRGVKLGDITKEEKK